MAVATIRCCMCAYSCLCSSFWNSSCTICSRWSYCSRCRKNEPLTQSDPLRLHLPENPHADEASQGAKLLLDIRAPRLPRPRGRQVDAGTARLPHLHAGLLGGPDAAAPALQPGTHLPQGVHHELVRGTTEFERRCKTTAHSAERSLNAQIDDYNYNIKWTIIKFPKIKSSF